MNKSSAYIPQPHVRVQLNTSMTFSCESNGELLRSCLWARPGKTKHTVTMKDNDSVSQGGNDQASYDRTSFTIGKGLHGDTCSVEIESVREEDLGPWSCILVQANGDVATGIVDVYNGKRKSCLQKLHFRRSMEKGQ